MNEEDGSFPEDYEPANAYVAHQVAVENWLAGRIEPCAEHVHDLESCMCHYRNGLTREFEDEFYIWVRPLIDWLDRLAKDPAWASFEFADYPAPPKLG